jgi:predicted nucleic acid-binding protein
MEKHPHPKISSMTKCSLAVSEISEIELLGKKNITRHEVEAILNLLNDCEVIDFSKSIKDITISIKQKYTIKTPDAIIAATAKSLNLPLVTADTGFKKIEDVDIILIDLNN